MRAGTLELHSVCWKTRQWLPRSELSRNDWVRDDAGIFHADPALLEIGLFVRVQLATGLPNGTALERGWGYLGWDDLQLHGLINYSG